MALSTLFCAAAGRLPDVVAWMGAAALVALFAAVVAGLLFLLWVRRVIRRYSDSGTPRYRSTPHPDDWARLPLHRGRPVDPDEIADERE